MPATDYLPSRLYNAFDKAVFGSDPLKALIALQGNPNYVSVWDDFTGTRTGSWPAGTDYAATVGVNSEVIGITQAVGGTMTLTTASGGSDSAGQGYGLNWSGDTGFYFISRCKLATRVTDVKFEVGMTDSVSDDGAVATKSVPTFTATDCGLFVYDTTDDINTTFVSNGGTSDANSDAGEPLGAVTITIAAPGVFSLAQHGLIAGERVVFATTGALPTGLTAGTAVFVSATDLTGATFTVSATAGGAQITTSGSQSGTHSATLLAAPVADTYFVVEIVGSGPTTATGASTTGDNVVGYLDGKLVGSGNIGGDAPLTPWWYVEDLATSAATVLTVDYWGCIGPRVAQWGVSA